MSSRFIRAVACIRISFILTVYTTIFHDGHLGCFCLLATIYNTAVNKIANSIQNMFESLLSIIEYVPRSARSSGNSAFNFLRVVVFSQDGIFFPLKRGKF